MIHSGVISRDKPIEFSTLPYDPEKVGSPQFHVMVLSTDNTVTISLNQRYRLGTVNSNTVNSNLSFNSKFFFSICL